MHEFTRTVKQAVLLSVTGKLVKCCSTPSRTAHLKYSVLRVACYCFTWRPKCPFRHKSSAKLLIFIGVKKKKIFWDRVCPSDPFVMTCLATQLGQLAFPLCPVDLLLIPCKVDTSQMQRRTAPGVWVRLMYFSLWRQSFFRCRAADIDEDKAMCGEIHSLPEIRGSLYTVVSCSRINVLSAGELCLGPVLFCWLSKLTYIDA